MTNKLYNKILKILKNKITFVILFIMIILFIIPVPYTIEGVGGITNLNKRFIIEDEYKSNGSFNMAYVLEYKANVLTYLYALINPNIDIEKKDDIDDDLKYMSLMMMDESIFNAIMVSYNKANIDVNITGEDIYVTYVMNDNTDLKIEDRIIKIDDIDIHSKSDITSIIKDKDYVNVTVINKGKTYIRYVNLMNANDTKYLGVTTSSKYTYKLGKDLEFKYDKLESGPSGGLMLSLSIYNKLISTDITKGYKIAGTGTIDKSGNVGSIGGVKYKVKGANKNRVDIFFVPEENYNDAIKYNNGKMKIVKVNTFDEAINYLNSL